MKNKQKYIKRCEGCGIILSNNYPRSKCQSCDPWGAEERYENLMNQCKSAGIQL